MEEEYCEKCKSMRPYVGGKTLLITWICKLCKEGTNIGNYR